MMFHVFPVPDGKLPAFMAIKEKPQSFFSGYFRLFRTPDGHEHDIDTRYDADLIAAGLLPITGCD